MVRIYTRAGDFGDTGLFTGERVSKDEARLEALGSIDEVVAALGVAKAEISDAKLRQCISVMQSDLYLLLADIASTAEQGSRVATRLPDDVVEILESSIDSYEADLPPLSDFIMPGDSRASAALHLARTICRRAERRVVTIARIYPLAARIPGYLNRLSDFLFVLARWVDRGPGGTDRIFKKNDMREAFMNTQDLLDFWRPMIDDPGNSWSIGTFGAVAEFHRTPDEPVDRRDTPSSLAITTAKGGLRVEASQELTIVPFDNLNSDGETWNHSVVFCARFAPRAPNVITPLGHDHEAIREEDRDAFLYDIGAGLGLVRMCVRTNDKALISVLDKTAGQHIFGPSGGEIMQAFLAAQPHRITMSPAGRAEVYQNIPLPGGQSPEGPHTHLLPKLVARNRTHSANSPIPDGLQPVLNLHPKSPWRDGLGKRLPYDREADDVFEEILAKYALPDDRAVRLRVEQAIRDGVMPKEFSWPETRRGRTEARVTLRRLAARTTTPALAAWRAEFDRVAEADEDAELHA